MEGKITPEEVARRAEAWYASWRESAPKLPQAND
jgi:hypothetical protein